MYQLLHEYLQAHPEPRPAYGRPERPGRGHPPPHRLRGSVAYALGAAARRLDADRARRAVA